ncbi:MAG TPA: hypothetical protein VK853_09405 [Ilumatobacteraceae bacterium]|nr:hypothetical protein [Ilumatobacteraceae bacterium]
MTDERIDSDAVITEALSVIDSALARMMQRELVSTGEVADLLLDVRTLLTAESTTLVETVAPVTTDAT